VKPPYVDIQFCRGNLISGLSGKAGAGTTEKYGPFSTACYAYPCSGIQSFKLAVFAQPLEKVNLA
jgi:hypothetical protein